MRTLIISDDNGMKKTYEVKNYELQKDDKENNELYLYFDIVEAGAIQYRISTDTREPNRDMIYEFIQQRLHKDGDFVIDKYLMRHYIYCI